MLAMITHLDIAAGTVLYELKMQGLADKHARYFHKRQRPAGGTIGRHGFRFLPIGRPAARTQRLGV